VVLIFAKSQSRAMSRQVMRPILDAVGDDAKIRAAVEACATQIRLLAEKAPVDVVVEQLDQVGGFCVDALRTGLQVGLDVVDRLRGSDDVNADLRAAAFHFDVCWAERHEAVSLLLVRA
jgi:hypothetical protein